jgi:hypothetical protein
MTYRHLSEFKLPIMILTCPCGRRGQYTVARQIEAYGDMRICDFIDMKVSAACELFRRPEKYRSCHAGCEDLLGMFTATPGTLQWAVENGYRNPDGTVKK